MLERSEQELGRLAALEQLRALGVEPYPAALYPITHPIAAITTQFDALAASEERVVVAGRIRARRIMGSASFISLQDESGSVQGYVKRDELCPGEDKTFYNTVFKKLLDLGDFVGIEGKVFRTQTGEISVHVDRLVLLAKSIRPLPVVKEKDGVQYDAFTDPELRYRQRYVDLALNPEVRKTFRQRQQIISAMRHFFDENGYLEVETPILQPIPGGASARPFITHHNALDTDLYLRIADELYLKRLLVGGYDGVYEFAKDFRNEGMDRKHNPEFSVLEIYVAYKDYLWMMDFVQEMLRRVVKAVHGSLQFRSHGVDFDFSAPFQRLSMRQAILQYGGLDIDTLDEEALRAECRKRGADVDASFGRGKLIDELFGLTAEEHLIQPTFLMDYPTEMSPLCKRHRSNPKLTERFELFVNGSELCNAYSELNDPVDQLARFQEQMLLGKRGDDEAMIIDYDYVRAMEYGMPPCSGMGIGIDRLAMLILDKASIQDVILFPQMRPEVWDLTPNPTSGDKQPE